LPPFSPPECCGIKPLNARAALTAIEPDSRVEKDHRMGRVTHSTKRKTAVWIAGLVGGLALASGLAAQPSAPSTSGKVVTVHINGADYGKLPTGLKVGDTINWVNDDTVAHTVTARDHSFDLHLNPGQSAKLTLQKDGQIPIFCIYHSTMRGVLTAAAH
jgi:plastocyanin